MQKTNDYTVKVTKAREKHISGMARCHINSFPGRFMTEMGYHWLYALYRFFIKHCGGICQVAIDIDSKVIGLAIGGNPNIRQEFISSAIFRYPHIIFWKFISRRMVRHVLLQELNRKFRRKHPTAEPGDTDHTGNLLSICVLPDYQGAGVAGKLIESFQQCCKSEGYKHLTLSVLSQNSRAVAFYKKHGWHQRSISGDSIRFVLDL